MTKNSEIEISQKTNYFPSFLTNKNKTRNFSFYFIRFAFIYLLFNYLKKKCSLVNIKIDSVVYKIGQLL